jgi:hypothetical protein
MAVKLKFTSLAAIWVEHSARQVAGQAMIAQGWVALPAI